MNNDWQYGLHSINERGAYLLQTQNFSDIQFLIGESSNQKIILGHKLILAMASPVFECMFYGQLATKSDIITITDVSPAAFYNLMEYIYSDHVNITSFEQAYELCYVANKYMLPHFFDECKHFIVTHLNPVDACRSYECGKLFDDQLLMQESMKTIVIHTQDVMNDPSFMNIEVDTLMDILDQEELSIESELDLFNILIRFAEIRGNKRVKAIKTINCKELENVSNDEDTKQTLKEIVKLNHDYRDIRENEKKAIVTGIQMEQNISNDYHIDDDSNDKPSGSQVLPSFVGPVSTISSDVIVIESDESTTSSIITTSNDSLVNKNDEVETNLNRKLMTEKDLDIAIKKIRYLAMTPQEFAEGPARSNYLKHHEALAILIKISCPTMTDLVMPAGFITSKSIRNGFARKKNSNQAQNLNNYRCNKETILTSSTEILNRSNNIYCVRAKYQRSLFYNANVSDCALTFQVDRNIWITGIQLPTQLKPSINPCGNEYTEILYVHIQHIHGSRIRYAHLTLRVHYDKIEEVTFDHPVYIHPNQIYKIFVTFNKAGKYPMFSCLTEIVCNQVYFKFNIDSSNESVRHDLIHGIIFHIPESN